ncbi:Lyase-like protein [Bufonid herpesvirus 1]|uniref:Lyase-like protein n=1 Tax=Bufonid herpesvirus 1 TaxID=2282206 RepID=UPI000EB69F52|nr:Lyase-like protein [Bufonid herpesvirus 1]AXF48544.1 Lyase-like protein [Bufonid herpesvirus 1]
MKKRGTPNSSIICCSFCSCTFNSSNLLLCFSSRVLLQTLSMTSLSAVSSCVLKSAPVLSLSLALRTSSPRHLETRLSSSPVDCHLETALSVFIRSSTHSLLVSVGCLLACVLKS